MNIDTVEHAEKTPDDEQPYAELGLKSELDGVGILRGKFQLIGGV